MNHPARRFAPKTVRQDWNAVRQELEQVSDRIGIRIPQEIEKKVGNFMKICHKAEDENHKTSNHG